MARLPGSLSDRALTTPTLRHSLLAAEPVLEVYHALGGELIKGQIVVLSKILTEIEQGKTGVHGRVDLRPRVRSRC